MTYRKKLNTWDIVTDAVSAVAVGATVVLLIILVQIWIVWLAFNTLSPLFSGPRLTLWQAGALWALANALQRTSSVGTKKS